MKPTPPKRKPIDRDGWYALPEIESIFAVSHLVFHATYRPHIPASAVRKQGGHVSIHAGSAIRAWVAHSVERELETAGHSQSPEKSKNLEAIRKQKAAQELMKTQRMCKTHADIEELHGGLSQLASILKSAIANVQRVHGNAVAQTLNEALIEFEKRIEVVIPTAAAAAGENDASIDQANEVRVQDRGDGGNLRRADYGGNGDASVQLDDQPRSGSSGTAGIPADAVEGNQTRRH